MNESDAIAIVQRARAAFGRAESPLVTASTTKERMVIATTGEARGEQFFVDLSRGVVYEMPTACRTADVFERLFPDEASREALRLEAPQ